ncbi:Flagellar basal-body rod protein FlgC [bacterium HR40]|nr:Flagellar basal-body rod protein FlgC [bacterium HR40]
MNLENTLAVASAGMTAQAIRLRVVAENLANAESTGDQPGAEPYRRKLVIFRNELDRALGVERVEVARYATDPSPFELRYEPGHPAANDKGYVAYPNVEPLVELVDMREAQRSYEANLGVSTVARDLLQRTIDLLR